MGVRGLTSFINERGIYKPLELRPNSKIIIDGDCLTSSMFFQMKYKNSCFGGDYDVYAAAVKDFLNMLIECKITPYVLFDGANSEKKFESLKTRMKERVRRTMNVNNHKKGILPLLVGEVCKSIVKKMNIQMLICDFECHQEVASLAKYFDCPVLSQESDYFVYEVQYIPFICDESTHLLNLHKKPGIQGDKKILECNIFDRNRFLSVFELSQDILPVLSIFLGNDFINRMGNTAHLYKFFSITDSQGYVETIIKWLAGKNATEVLEKLLQFFNESCSYAKQEKLLEILNWFQCKESKFAKYFETQSVNDIDSLFDVPKDFLKKYRNNFYYHHLLNMILYDKYFPKAQIELAEKSSSHSNSFPIISVIYKILKNNSESDLIFYGQFENSLKAKTIEKCSKDVPNLEQIQTMDCNARLSIFLEILGIEKSFFQNCIAYFPKSWHIFLIAIKYFKMHSDIELSFVYSLILSKIMITLNDMKDGSKMYKFYGQSKHIEPVSTALRKIHRKDCNTALHYIYCYSHIKKDLRKNFKLYDLGLVHCMSEFQSCLFHVNMLNGVFNKPYEDCNVWECYNGTFLYNICFEVNKQNVDFIYHLLERSPTVSNLFSTIIENVIHYML